VTGRPKIHAHQFIGYLMLYALGLRTRAEIAARWSLEGDEITQAGLVADSIDEALLISAEAAHRQVGRFDAVTMLLGIRDPEYVTGTTINEAKVAADAGF
jgi:hypothetical protein